MSSSNRVNLYSGIYHHRADYDDINIVFVIRVLHNNDGEFLKMNISLLVIMLLLFPINLGNWYDVVGTYDGEKMRLYINGTSFD